MPCTRAVRSLQLPTSRLVAVPPPRTSWRRRPLLALILLILLLVIGYIAQDVDGDHGKGSQRGPSVVEQLPSAQPASTAHDGGRLAAKAAIPS